MNLTRITNSLVLLAFLTVAASGGTWASGTVKNSSGTLDYKLWAPSDYRKDKPFPLVLMLHGCTQKAEDLAAISGMNELADKNKFLVVYPEQGAAANPLRCWNWFDPKHQSRDAGEPSLIAAVVSDVRFSYSIDSKHVYAVGVSAGGAMSVVMVAAYPETFAGLGVIAGLEYKAGTTVQAGLAAMKQGGPDPTQQGLLAFQAMQKTLGGSEKRIPVIAFQGMKDPYVNPLNTDQLITQWAQTYDYLDDGKDNDSVSIQSPKEAKGSVPNGYSFTKYSYYDGAKRLLMEKWLVQDLGHAWPGSATASQFGDPKGPNASAEMWRFFVETNLYEKPKGGDR